tara:strand:- start:680 stop:2194 length:1515 start_codon:yes stop_codon:yes gene_type:complete
MSLYDKLHDVNSYKVHTFTSTGNSTFAVTGSGDIEYLVIAGGGGGGRDDFPSGRGTGGGGAGGFRTNVYGVISGGGSNAEAKYGVTAQNYTITVGTGGAGGTGSSTTGSDGVNSSIVPASGTSIISTGGGGGGGHNDSANFAGRDGGSGGGAPNANSSSYVGSGVSGQGYDGGAPYNPSPYYGSGGGGAGSVGGAASSGGSGNGGLGLQSSINGTTTYYAGGGGGHGVGSQGSGGSGGGGSGSSGTGGAGTTNTGSGGGAGDSAGAGGSGIVIIRYKTSSGITATGGTITNIVTGIAKQRVVENFTGDALDTDRWKMLFSTGTGTATMSDSIDGGLIVSTTAGANHDVGVSFNTTTTWDSLNIRNFAHNSSVYIDVFKQNGVSSAHKVIVHGMGERIRGDGAGNNASLWGSGVNMNTNYFMSRTCASNGSQSDTASDVAYDQNWHNYKIENKSASVEYTLDGVLKTNNTTTTNLPASRMAPLNGAQANGSVSSYSIRYVECYNT